MPPCDDLVDQYLFHAPGHPARFRSAMISLEFPSHENTGEHLDAKFLLRQVPALARVKQGYRTWDEFGEKIARDFQGGSESTDPSAPSLWSRAKELVHAVMAGSEPRFDPIRKRIGKLQKTATPALLSTLSLWLAGELGVSLSATQPMTAAALYAVSQASGNWEILRSN